MITNSLNTSFPTSYKCIYKNIKIWISESDEFFEVIFNSWSMIENFLSDEVEEWLHVSMLTNAGCFLNVLVVLCSTLLFQWVWEGIINNISYRSRNGHHYFRWVKIWLICPGAWPTSSHWELKSSYRIHFSSHISTFYIKLDLFCIQHPVIIINSSRFEVL